MGILSKLLKAENAKLYDLGEFPANDNLYCPDCDGQKTRAGNEFHAWNCPRKREEDSK